ncbi:MAG TPA: SRPBCC family protein [Chthonomonadales bacterium]|nr:SRPBCC family protein [Chthonomonadales bacterium]
MATHTASVTMNAPVHQVYQLFSHFNDFPKFMFYVKEVTYYDDQRSHWVADVVGRHEWDAVNDNWVENRQIGWRSTDGLQNSGVVRFVPVSDTQTRIDVTINYDPPSGWVGDIGEVFGAGKKFEATLQQDLDNFAEMVAQAPRGALDPNSSSYLFHEDSAAAQGETTEAQNASMAGARAPGE